MGLAYAGFVVRTERRIRLLFSGTLAPGAFGPGSAVAALYVVTSLDGAGASPAIAAALQVPGAPSNVELALTTDLVAGGAYTVTSALVPGTDGSLSASVTQPFVFGDKPAATINIEAAEEDVGALVYGVDLVWTGADFLETPAGDLATVSGVENVKGAQLRRLTADDPLPWDQSYGTRAGSYVYGPATSGVGLLGVLRRQAIADDRIAIATVVWTEDPAHPGDEYFRVTQELRSSDPGTELLQTNVVNPSAPTT